MYRVVDSSSFEGRRKPIAKELGAHAIKLNRFDSQPGQEGFTHDERESRQEEIYIAVAGAGEIRIADQLVPFAPGRFVLVSPEETRQVVAGPEGLSYVVVGAVVETS